MIGSALVLIVEPDGLAPDRIPSAVEIEERAPAQLEAHCEFVERPLSSFYARAGARISLSARSPRRSSRLRSASAFTSAPNSSASPVSQSHVSITITADSEPQVLLYEAKWV